MAATPTSNISFQNFFSATLTADISATSTDIFLDNIPNGTEGFLVIDPLNTTGHEIIYYNTKGASKVTCPSVADGRGQDDTNASSHLTGTTVIMAPIAAYYETLLSLFTTSPQGWSSLAGTFTANTHNGNRSYTVSTSTDQSSILSPGMRLRSTATVAGPTQCASLNGTTQYFSKATPAGMTFTTTFSYGAWIKLTSYPASNAKIIARFDAAGNNGSGIDVNSTGQLRVITLNAASNKIGSTQQSAPLNKWVHVVITTDMAGAITAYMDGVAVPSSVAGSITSIAQGTDLVVGAFTGGSNPFPGKIAQAFVASKVLSATEVKAIYSQGLTAPDMTTYNIISAFSLSGASGLTDINTANANNLTTNGAATTTTADSFRGQNALGTISSTLDYAIVTAVTSSTMTYQVPEGCTVPTSGGISAMSYSTYKTPYGFPADRERFTVKSVYNVATGQATPVAGTVYNAGHKLSLPSGSWILGWSSMLYGLRGAAGTTETIGSLSTSASVLGENELIGRSYGGGITETLTHATRQKGITVATATDYFLNLKTSSANQVQVSFQGDIGSTVIFAEPSYL